MMKTCNRMEDTRNPLVLHSEAMKSFFSQIQRLDQSLLDFSREINAKICMLDGLGHSHVVDIEGPLKDKLMEIFEAKGGKELLDGVTDLEEKQRTILKFFRDCALAMQLQLRANREQHGKY